MNHRCMVKLIKKTNKQTMIYKKRRSKLEYNKEIFIHASIFSKCFILAGAVIDLIPRTLVVRQEYTSSPSKGTIHSHTYSHLRAI